MSPEITIGLAVLLALFVVALVAGITILRHILALDQDQKAGETAHTPQSGPPRPSDPKLQD